QASKLSSCPACPWGRLSPEGQVLGGTMGATRRSCLELKTANRRELAVERAAKKEAVEQLHEVFKATGVAVVAHYSGLTVAQMQKLRMQMKQAGASVKVSKNRLAKILLKALTSLPSAPC